MKIAFTGISGAGKDYLLSYLTSELKFTRVSFSDQLKKIAKRIYPWLESDYPPLIKEQPLNITLESGEIITKTPREIWLHLNKLREIENGLFLRMLSEELELLNVENVVISDIRTQIEFDWCKENNFTIIYIEPIKHIYEPNEFDTQVLSYKENVDYVYVNDFNGLDTFKDFIRGIKNEK